jgi:hypothetical protein
MATDGHIRAAQVRWELQLAILQEEERRVVDALEEHSRRGIALPQKFLDRLKAARSQCNEAFQSLMACIERRAVAASHWCNTSTRVLGLNPSQKAL